MTITDRDIDILIRYLQSDRTVDLTDTLQTKMEAMEYIFNLFDSSLKRSEIISTVKKKFDVSPQTANKMVHSCESLFSKKKFTQREFLRSLTISQCQRFIKRCYDQGKDKEAALHMANLIKIAGLDKETLDLPNPDEFVPPALTFEFNPALLGRSTEGIDIDALKKSLEARLLDKKMGRIQGSTEYTPYEEVKE